MQPLTGTVSSCFSTSSAVFWWPEVWGRGFVPPVLVAEGCDKHYRSMEAGSCCLAASSWVTCFSEPVLVRNSPGACWAAWFSLQFTAAVCYRNQGWRPGTSPCPDPYGTGWRLCPWGNCCWQAEGSSLRARRANSISHEASRLFSIASASFLFELSLAVLPCAWSTSRIVMDADGRGCLMKPCSAGFVSTGGVCMCTERYRAWPGRGKAICCWEGSRSHYYRYDYHQSLWWK